MAPNLMAPHPSELGTSTVHLPRRPASERVAGILADRIRAGIYSNGNLLPTERALAADLGVHRRSVRAAIEFLAQEGMVSHRPNCRPTVDWSPSDDTEAPDDTKTLDDTQAKGYNQAARISTSNLIALIMWHGGGPLEHAGTSQQRIFWGMNQSLTKAGYHAVFLDLGDVLRPEKEIAAQEAEHLRYICDQGFGGALFYPYAYNYNRELVAEVSRSVPLVLLDRKISGVDIDFVGVENRGALFEVTQHLIAQGHRRIAYVTRYEPIQSVQDRIQGYLDAMREQRASEGSASDLTEMILTLPPYRAGHEWGVVDAVFGLPQGQRPTAAVCFTDYMAVSFAERMDYLGLSIPGDVAVTGFDNIVPTLPNGVGLTTVAQPYEEIGTTAVEMLMRRIKDRHLPPASVEIPARLITRASSTA